MLAPNTGSVGVAGYRHINGRPDFTFSKDGNEIRGDQLEEEYDFQNGVFGYDNDQFDDITPADEDLNEKRRGQKLRNHQSAVEWEPQGGSLVFVFANSYQSVIQQAHRSYKLHTVEDRVHWREIMRKGLFPNMLNKRQSLYKSQGMPEHKIHKFYERKRASYRQAKVLLRDRTNRSCLEKWGSMPLLVTSSVKMCMGLFFSCRICGFFVLECLDFCQLWLSWHVW